MAYDQFIELIDRETVLAECGPMRLTIRACQGSRPQLQLCRHAAAEAFGFLQRVAKWRKTLSQPAGNIRTLPEDTLALQMIHSVKSVGDPDLTPMAAVAGAIADAVADWIFERGGSRVIVDNGGDVAVRLAKGETVNVGVRPSIRAPNMSHLLVLDSQRSSWGVTTSGFGGRSFTRGIASAVTALAASAVAADAASTAIANACFVQDENIRQIPAERIDPNTDLAGCPVTVHIGKLSAAKRKAAQINALQRAEDLVARGVIVGALICQNKRFAMTSSLNTWIHKISDTRY